MGRKYRPFTNLMSPLTVGCHTFKNRIVNAPMAFGLIALDPEAGPRAYRKIEAIAEGGAAAVYVGETNVNFTDADRLPFPPFDYSEHGGKAFEAIGHYATLIKKHGALAMIELAHPGSEKTPFEGQKGPIGPVNLTRPDGVKVAAMTDDDMARVIKDFEDAASFMKAAGFDGVLIHAGHGFLFTQFLSPRLNTRTDTYGGPLENRARFPLNIIRGIRERVGSDFLIEVRLSATEGVQGGITLDDIGRFCRMLEGTADLIHVSAGLYTEPIKTRQFSSMYVPHGFNAAVSDKLKKYTTLPVGVVGGFNSPEQAEQIIAEGMADYVILGRQMLADPYFPAKAFNGKADEIRRCIRCFNCFPGSPEEGYKDIPWSSAELSKRVGNCTINPIANLPIDLALFPTPSSPKTVLIAGGGPAGMQAAITAADRGHRVVLAESEHRLGGMLNFTETDVSKQDLRDFKNLLIRLTERCGAQILLNTVADATLIRKLQPDAVILAVGSRPAVPSIPGIDKIQHAVDVYKGYPMGKRVIVVGGGLVGCETGLHLAKTGHMVTVIEKLPRIANDSFGMYREALTMEMESEGIKVLTEMRCQKITPGSVRIVDKDGNESVLKGDTVIYALGMSPNSTEEIDSITQNIRVYKVGDCARPGKVESAVRSGFLAALEIM